MVRIIATQTPHSPKHLPWGGSTHSLSHWIHWRVFGHKFVSEPGFVQLTVNACTARAGPVIVISSSWTDGPNTAQTAKVCPFNETLHRLFVLLKFQCDRRLRLRTSRDGWNLGRRPTIKCVSSHVSRHSDWVENREQFLHHACKDNKFLSGCWQGFPWFSQKGFSYGWGDVSMIQGVLITFTTFISRWIQFGHPTVCNLRANADSNPVFAQVLLWSRI